MECWKGEEDPLNVSFTINGEKFESEMFVYIFKKMTN